MIELYLLQSTLGEVHAPKVDPDAVTTATAPRSIRQGDSTDATLTIVTKSTEGIVTARLPHRQKYVVGTTIDTIAIVVTSANPTTMINVIVTTVVERLAIEAGAPRSVPHAHVRAVPPRDDATDHNLSAPIVSLLLLPMRVSLTDG